MSKLHIPPPSLETMLAFMIEWLARHLRARVTLTVYKTDKDHFTEEYDGHI